MLARRAVTTERAHLWVGDAVPEAAACAHAVAAQVDAVGVNVLAVLAQDVFEDLLDIFGHPVADFLASDILWRDGNDGDESRTVWCHGSAMPDTEMGERKRSGLTARRPWSEPRPYCQSSTG